MMRDTSLYHDDIVTWSEEQAEALRLLAAASPGNGVDWENVIEEIECLGRTERRGVEAHLIVALIHVVKGSIDLDSMALSYWTRETRAALREVRDDFRPSMRRHIDLDATWRRAVDRACDELEEYRVSIPPRIPATCPFPLDALLDPSFTFEEGRRILHGLMTSGADP